MTPRMVGGTNAVTINTTLDPLPACDHWWVEIYGPPDKGEDYGTEVVAIYCLDCGAWEDL